MTILFLDQFDEVGGAQRSLLELAPALREAGARRTPVCRATDRSPSG